MSDFVLPCIKEIPFSELKGYIHSELYLCGVYAICVKNTGGSSDGMWYIGSTTQSFAERIVDHRRRLRNGNHHTYRLQHVFTKHGEESFFALIVETISKEGLDKASIKFQCLDREQYWIDFIGFENLFNESPTAGSPYGRRFSLAEKNSRLEKRKKQTTKAETLKLFSMASSARWKDPAFQQKMKEVHKQVWENRTLEKRKQIGVAISNKIRSDPKSVEARREQFKKNWQNPECRERMIARSKETMRSSRVRRIISESTKKCWSDENHSKERTLNIVKGLASQKNPCVLISPDSKKYVTDNASGFCRSFCLNLTAVCRMLKGKQYTSMGWTGYKLTSWADVPNDAIRILWGDHPDLPEQTQTDEPIAPKQLSLNF